MSAARAIDLIVDALRDHGQHVACRGTDKYEAQCPAHDDQKPSLCIGLRKDGTGAVIHCQAMCQYADVLAALGLTPRDLFDDAAKRQAYNPSRTYRYPNGLIVQRRPDRKGGKDFWQEGNKDDSSLYNADMITPDTDTVYAPEGEKDCDVLVSEGVVAVCAKGGAGKAHRGDWTPVYGHHVVIVMDNDPEGEKDARGKYDLLVGKTLSVRVLRSPFGKDYADHAATGHGIDELVNVPMPPSEQLPPWETPGYAEGFADALQLAWHKCPENRLLIEKLAERYGCPVVRLRERREGA